MKGLCGSFPNADTKAKPTEVVCDVPYVLGELGVAKAFDITTNNGNYQKKKQLCAFNPEMLGMILVGASRLTSENEEKNKAPPSSLSTIRNHQQAPFLQHIYSFRLFAFG